MRSPDRGGDIRPHVFLRMRRGERIGRTVYLLYFLSWKRVSFLYYIFIYSFLYYIYYILYYFLYFYLYITFYLYFSENLVGHLTSAPQT